MKQYLLKNTILTGIMMSAVVALNACTPLSELDADDNWSSSDGARKKPAITQTVCTAENPDSCIVTYEEPDLNLSQAYAGYAMSTDASYLAGSTPMALSSPATQGGSSVKERMRQRELAQQRADLALQPVANGDVVCSGDECNEMLFKTEIEKTIHTRVTEDDQSNSVYVAAQGYTTPTAGVSHQTARTAVATVAQAVANVPVGTIVTESGEVVPAEQMGAVQTAHASQTVQNVVASQSVAQQQGVKQVAQTSDVVPVVPAQQDSDVNTNVETQQTSTTTQTVKATKTTEKTTEKTTKSLKEKILFGEQVHDWEAPAGETLRTLLMRWGAESGWTVVWKMDRDYNLEAGVVFRGKFTEVAAAFIRSFARATPAPIGTFYKGNRVLVINTQENDNAN